MVMSKALLATSVVTLTVLPFIIKYLLKRRYRNLLHELNKPDDSSYYECIFIDYKNFNCKSHLIDRIECGETCSYTYLKRLLHYIGSAQKSVSMCMGTLTLRQVITELVNVHKRGVTVRVIFDRSMSRAAPVQSNLAFLEKNGITVKIPASTDELMHHKFCLIDEADTQRRKLLFGSINLTAQAFCRNFESLVFTNNADIIQRLSDEFEVLWGRF